MNSRVHSRARCGRCQLREVLCLCAEIPALSIRGKITVLMHKSEAKLSSNTARLVTLAIPQCEIRVRGIREAPMRTDDLKNSATHRAMILFPSDDAVELSEVLVGADPRPIHLIVPDGSWNQARKVAQREPALRLLPRVRLPFGPPSQYFLREAPTAESLCTLEAIARFLGVTDGAETQSRLEAIFRVMVERTLWSRGKIPASQCSSPIPQAAFDAFFRDGCLGSMSSAMRAKARLPSEPLD